MEETKNKVELLGDLLTTVYRPEGNVRDVVYKTSHDLLRDFSEFVSLQSCDLYDVGKAMRSLGYKLVTIGGRPYWELYSVELSQEEI